MKARAFGILAFLQDSSNATSLFMIGGLNPLTFQHVPTIEVYEKATDTWMPYKELSESDSLMFPSGVDSGCVALQNGQIVTIGQKLAYLDLFTWEVSPLSLPGWQKIQDGEVCSYQQLQGGDSGLLFSSGKWFSLITNTWTELPTPESSFIPTSIRGKPTLLGTAKQNGTCGDNGCDGNTLYGDDSVFQIDSEEKKWKKVAVMMEERLAYASTVKVPGALCQKLALKPEPEVGIDYHEKEREIQTMKEVINTSNDSQEELETESITKEKLETNKNGETDTEMLQDAPDLSIDVQHEAHPATTVKEVLSSSKISKSTTPLISIKSSSSTYRTSSKQTTTSTTKRTTRRTTKIMTKRATTSTTLRTSPSTNISESTTATSRSLSLSPQVAPKSNAFSMNLSLNSNLIMMSVLVLKITVIG